MEGKPKRAKTRRRALTDTVHLVAYDRNGKQVLQEFLSVRDYREESHPVLDEHDFRKARRIVRLRGQMYDEAGRIVEEFVVCYNSAGFAVRDAARLGNGTIIGAWKELTG